MSVAARGSAPSLAVWLAASLQAGFCSRLPCSRNLCFSETRSLDILGPLMILGEFLLPKLAGARASQVVPAVMSPFGSPPAWADGGSLPLAAWETPRRLEHQAHCVQGLWARLTCSVPRGPLGGSIAPVGQMDKHPCSQEGPSWSWQEGPRGILGSIRQGGHPGSVSRRGRAQGSKGERKLFLSKW